MLLELLKYLCIGLKIRKMRITIFVILMFSSGFSGTIPMKKGNFATGCSHPDSEELQWLRNFDLIQIGGVEDESPDSVINCLHSSGVKLLSYEWMPAGYHYTDGSPDNPFMAWVYPRRDSLTLNPNGPFPHCRDAGYNWCEDYYYDLAIPSLVSRRIDYLMTSINNYDGLFFDWASGGFIDGEEYTPMRDTFYTRHPGLVYSAVVGEFYRNLKSADSSKLIMTNQGFRRCEYILPVVDYDMTESYATTCEYFGDVLYIEGIGLREVPRTIYYPVSEDYRTGHIEDHIHYLHVLKLCADDYGGPNFKNYVYMNYASPDFVPTGDTVNGYAVYRPEIPRNAIYFAYVIPKLVNFMVYTETPWDHRYERDSVYFYDLGEPLGNSYDSLGDHVFVRYYTRGFVIAGEWQDTTQVHLESPYIPSNIPFYDAYEQQWDTTGVNSVDFVVRPKYDSLIGRMAPSGRIFLYDMDYSGIDESGIPSLLVRDELYIGFEGVKMVELFDISGRVVFKSNVPFDRRVPIPYKLRNGIFFAEFLGSDGRVIAKRKIIVIR